MGAAAWNRRPFPSDCYRCHAPLTEADDVRDVPGLLWRRWHRRCAARAWAEERHARDLARDRAYAAEEVRVLVEGFRPWVDPLRIRDVEDALLSARSPADVWRWLRRYVPAWHAGTAREAWHRLRHEAEAHFRAELATPGSGEGPSVLRRLRGAFFDDRRMTAPYERRILRWQQSRALRDA
jgi:hypothetical protein